MVRGEDKEQVLEGFCKKETLHRVPVGRPRGQDSVQTGVTPVLVYCGSQRLGRFSWPSPGMSRYVMARFTRYFTKNESTVSGWSRLCSALA